ncbi:HEAT repeat domain-containing protein [Streptomyces sp. NPDC055749]
MLEGLDAADWRGLEPVRPDRPATDIPKVLRRIARADATTRPDAVERAYGDLQDLLLSPGRVTDACTAALPFLVDLALDRDTVARPDVVDVLAGLALNGAAGENAAPDPGWEAAWQRQWPRLRGLLSDTDPPVRRAALQLISDRTAPLLDRWREETDLSVRVTVLLALGEAAASEESAGAKVDEVRAVLDGVLHGEDGVLRVAAAVATSSLDPQAPLRASPMLLEILTDPKLAPVFEKVWYTLNCEYPYDRADVAGWVVHLLERDVRVAISFVAGLAEAGSRTGDADLRRCALDEAWQLLVFRPSAATVFLPLAAGLLADPDDDVRYKAAHLLAVLGRRAAPYADRLAALLDDSGESQFFDGTVGDHARWALTRIGDPRALPDLVERLVAPYRDMQGRGYCLGDPRQPDVADVLRPLRAHAGELLPAVREALRDEVAREGWLTGELREVLQAWGEDPILPGETQPYPKPWEPPLMEPAEAEEAVLAFAPDGETFGTFSAALSSLTHHGRLTTPVSQALAALRDGDHRLSQYADYRTFLQDEEIRERIDAVLALP